MAGKRVVDPYVFAGESFTKLGHQERLTYLGLWLNADDDGRLSGSAVEIRNRIFPADDGDDGRSIVTSQQVIAWCNHIAAVGLIAIYRHGGKPYIVVRGFRDAQPRRWYSPSRYPAPPDNAFANTTENTECAEPALPHCRQRGHAAAGEERKGEERKERTPTPSGSGRASGASDSLESTDRDPAETLPEQVASPKPTPRAAPVEAVVIPADLAAYAGPIRAWLEYKRERRQGYKPRGLVALWKLCRELGADLPASIDRSMANSWQGLFPVEQAARRSAEPPAPARPATMPAQRRDAICRAMREALPFQGRDRVRYGGRVWRFRWAGDVGEPEPVLDRGDLTVPMRPSLLDAVAAAVADIPDADLLAAVAAHFAANPIERAGQPVPLAERL